MRKNTHMDMYVCVCACVHVCMCVCVCVCVCAQIDARAPCLQLLMPENHGRHFDIFFFTFRQLLKPEFCSRHFLPRTRTAASSPSRR